MQLEEFRKRQKKARRATIFSKDDKLISPSSLTKRSVCNVHLILAEKIVNSSLPMSEKTAMLLLVNEAYNLGKRMATKLDYYGAEKDFT